MNKIILHENKNHGSLDFPYTVYHGMIPEYINSFPLHWHDEIEFILVVKGELNVSINTKSYVLHANDIAIILPKIAHSLDKGLNQSSEYYNILFNFSIFKNFSYGQNLQDKYLAPFLNHHVSVDAVAQNGSDLQRELFPLLNELTICRHESYTTKEMLILGNIFRVMYILNEFKKVPNEFDKALNLSLEKIKKAVYTVQNQYHQNITVEQVASVCGFSQSHFMKLFKELTGDSFTDYLINYRLEVAAKQIRNSKQKIVDIAFDCGFNNQSYFTRAFYKNFGLSPKEYRKKHLS